MAFALPLLVPLVAALHIGTRSVEQAWMATASPQGPPFILQWRAAAGGTRVLEVIPRWARAGAITLTRVDAGQVTPAASASFALRGSNTFTWEPGIGPWAPASMRIIATWRDPAGRAGATATATWPEPAPPPAPRFTPMPPVRVDGITLDHAINLP